MDDEKNHSHREMIAALHLAEVAKRMVPTNHPCQLSLAVAGLIGLAPTIATLPPEIAAPLFEELHGLIYKQFILKHLPELQSAGLKVTPAGRELAEKNALDTVQFPTDPTRWN